MAELLIIKPIVSFTDFGTFIFNSTLSLELSVDNEDELPPTLEADGVDGRVRTSVFSFFFAT